jgi:hypothetical protein
MLPSVFILDSISGENNSCHAGINADEILLAVCHRLSASAGKKEVKAEAGEEQADRRSWIGDLSLDLFPLGPSDPRLHCAYLKRKRNRNGFALSSGFCSDFY